MAFDRANAALQGLIDPGSQVSLFESWRSAPKDIIVWHADPDTWPAVRDEIAKWGADRVFVHFSRAAREKIAPQGADIPYEVSPHLTRRQMTALFPPWSGTRFYGLVPACAGWYRGDWHLEAASGLLPEGVAATEAAVYSESSLLPEGVPPAAFWWLRIQDMYGLFAGLALDLEATDTAAAAAIERQVTSIGTAVMTRHWRWSSRPYVLVAPSELDRRQMGATDSQTVLRRLVSCCHDIVVASPAPSVRAVAADVAPCLSASSSASVLAPSAPTTRGLMRAHTELSAAVGGRRLAYQYHMVRHLLPGPGAALSRVAPAVTTAVPAMAGDGITVQWTIGALAPWTTIPYSGGWGSISSISYNSGMWVCWRRYVASTYSNDKGLTWSAMPASLPWGGGHRGAYGAGRWVVVNGEVWTIDDIKYGAATRRSCPISPIDIVFNGERFFAIDNSGHIATSFDGISWIIGPTIPISSPKLRLGRQDIAVIGGTSIFFINAAGAVWSPTQPPVARTWTGASYGAGRWIFWDDVGNVASYFGGIWTQLRLPSTTRTKLDGAGNVFPSMTYVGGIFLVCYCWYGNPLITAASFDGISWSVVSEQDFGIIMFPYGGTAGGSTTIFAISDAMMRMSV